MGTLSPTSVTAAANPETLDALPVRSLRALILASGGEHFDILEKTALVERAKELLTKPPPPPPEEPVLHSAHALQCQEMIAKEDQMAEAQRSSVVRLCNFLSDAEIQSVHELAARLGDAGRSVESAAYRTGAWDTSYLQAGGAFASQLPALAAKLVDAAREVDEAQGWRLLADKPRVTMRVVEYHTVKTHGSLPWAHHFDEGSLLTIDCMLSDPTTDFAGGVFETLEPDGELKPHAFERGDVQVFRSHKYHCVSPVTSGARNVLVIELWDGEERRCAHRCEQRTGRCAFERCKAM